MNQSTCTKCKRFILRKCPCAFYGADNDLRLADDCNPIVATGNDRLEPILETFNARMVEFDEVLQRLGDVEDATNRLAAATDGLFTDLVAMSARQIILEERFARLERAVRAGPATSAGSSYTLTDVCLL
ncbi:hypothetical protein ALC56_09852 [Trachymyrmex septentrionalis]|uniref:Uncharacterized protein n=1 Tax=Trachymyrmex septentrionalis TaxID=34720 RepID=A0A151JUH7_9HYME|nr:hypothetical protein ALC56_09852 [Trachymyrmex septentrionalis]